MTRLTDTEPRFFLTRQSANILEDLARHIKGPGTVCLLHGPQGIGKTRLLKAFFDRISATHSARMICFVEDGRCINGVSTEEQDSPFEFSQNFLDSLEEGVLLIIDDFHLAKTSVMHLVIRHWVSYGSLKKQSLIIAGSSELLDALAKLDLRLARPIISAMLQPLNASERLEYLTQTLCENSRQQLTVNRRLKRELRDSGGLFRELEQLAQRYQASAACVERSQNSWYQTSASLVMALVVVAVIVSALLVMNIGLVSDVETMPSKDFSNTPAIAELKELHPAPSSSVEVATIPNQETTPQLTGESDNDLTSGLLANTDALAEKKPLIETITTRQSEAHSQSPEIPLLARRMLATDEWLANSHDAIATVQILSVATGRDPEGALIEYLTHLTESGVEAGQLYVYRVKRKSGAMYGVLFGSFPDRQTAFRTIETLPSVLRANNPIPRTVKGLKKELRR